MSAFEDLHRQRITGSLGTYLARLATVLGRPDDALRLFERADAQLRALRAPFWQARNQVEWARQLSTRGSDSELHRARELLAEATTTAVAVGRPLASSNRTLPDAARGKSSATATGMRQCPPGVTIVLMKHTISRLLLVSAPGTEIP